MLIISTGERERRNDGLWDESVSSTSGRTYNRLMRSAEAFIVTEPDLFPVLEELRRREPIFHRPEFASDQAGFEQMMAPDYWEVGASGRRYSRDFILRTLEENPPVHADTAGWQSSDHQCRRLGPDTYLFTYTLRQGDRVTRRVTIWLNTPDGWQILYHQGTIVSSEEEDVTPSKS